jgi:heme exporter protein C
MNNRLINWFKFASPQTFYPLAGKMIPWFWALTAVFGIAGLYIGFLVAPTDAHLSLLGAGLIVAWVLGPAATALAVRIAHE